MTTRPSAVRAPRVRLLWDELLSPRVAQALRILGYPVSHVGHATDNQPNRGASDSEIVEHSKRTNTVIVTSNYDMMQICAEASQRFVWLDPGRRPLTRAKQLLVVLQQIDEWERILASDDVMCVHALRTKCSAITPTEAARLATQRMKRTERRKHRTRPRSVTTGPELANE